MSNLSAAKITFCIISTVHRAYWLARTLESIEKYCPVKYIIKLLVQGGSNVRLLEIVRNYRNVEVIISPVNIGCGGGRHLLTQLSNSPFTMTLDDDMYLTEGAIKSALEVLENNLSIAAVSMPQYDLDGRIISPGGRKIIIKNGVIVRKPIKLDFRKKWIEADDLDGGAMLFRTQLRADFSWDGRFFGAFDDLDKSLQILTTSRWKQAVAVKGKLIHDRSWLGKTPDYERMRFDGLAIRRSYKLFRKKWSLRMELREHIQYEIVYPILTFMRFQKALSLLQWLIRLRTMRHYTREA